MFFKGLVQSCPAGISTVSGKVSALTIAEIVIILPTVDKVQIEGLIGDSDGTQVIGERYER
jgi:hypothetical protein